MHHERLATNESVHGPEPLVVRMNRPRLLFVAIFLLLAGTIAGDEVFGFPPTFRWDVDHVIGLVVLPLFGIIAVLGFIASFSPFPLLKISHEGIRRFSFFGLFGTNMTLWSQVKSITCDQTQYGREIVIKLAYPPMPRPGKGLIRHLVSYPWAPQIRLPNGMITVSLDELLFQIRLRYGHELAEHGVEIDLDQSQDVIDS